MVYAPLVDGLIPAYWDHHASPSKYFPMVNAFTVDATHAFLSARYPSVAESYTESLGWPAQLTIGIPPSDTWTNAISGSKFFYPISVHWWLSHELEFWRDHIRIDEQVIAEILSGRCKILLHNMFEGWAAEIWVRIIRVICDRYPGLGLDDFVVISNNVRGSPGSIWLAHVNNQRYWQNSGHHASIEALHSALESDLRSNKIRTHRFVSLNRQPSPSRWIVLTELFDDRHRGLLSFGVFTDLPSFGGRLSDMDDPYRVEIQRRLSQRGTPEWNARENFKMLSPAVYRSYQSRGIERHLPLMINDGIDIRTNPTADASIAKFTDSYLHIVTETYMQDDLDDRMHFSEKIFKPMWYLQPFVVCGQRHSLRALRDLGYMTFSSWIDECYDDIEDDVSRIIAAMDSAKRFYNQSSEDINLQMLEMLPVFKHNFQCLRHNADMLHLRLLDRLGSLIQLDWR